VQVVGDVPRLQANVRLARFHEGSPAPTATQADPITEHGRTVYVTHKETVLDDCLLTISTIGVPSVIAAGAILHFLMEVKLFPNAPTLKEY
jgi:hypothetical protein